MEISLVMRIATAFLALLVIHRLLRRYLEYLVRIPPISPLSHPSSAYFIRNGNSEKVLTKAQRNRPSQSDKAFGERHGCLPTAMLINGWPLGIDRLKQIWEADRESRLMELFLMHFRMWGNT